MKLKKPKTKDIIIFFETAIISYFLFRYWDEVKTFIFSIFN